MEVIDGVAETLAYLAERHDLTFFTKGHVEEQKLKIDRSGLGVYFGHTAIVKEKDAAAYLALVEERAMDASAGVDDREQPEIGHQSGAGGWAECGVRAALADMDPGAAGDPAGKGASCWSWNGSRSCARGFRGLVNRLVA